MTRSEWKAAARARLGGGIFKDQWLMGVVFCLVVSAIVGAAGSILPGVGALVVTGERDRVYEDGACVLTPQLNQVGTAGVAESVGAFGVDGDGAVPCRERRRGRSKSLWCANDIGDALSRGGDERVDRGVVGG